MKKRKKAPARRSPRSAAVTGRRQTTSRRRKTSHKSTRFTGVNKLERRIFGMKIWHLGSITAVLVCAVLVVVFWGLQPAKKGSADSGCSVSATLVNSCRPWLGAASANYGATGFAAEIANHESRIGRQVDVVHDYRNSTASQDVLNTDEINLAKRANTYLMLNWKPADPWSDGTGGNATVNGQIDAMANSIKSLGSKKIFLAIYHEPEDNVSSGASCTNGVSGFAGYKGSSGTPADYVNMWHNVRSRFDALGVTNVVWVMNYMGFTNWDCMVNDMWPGNNYVDWVVWDPYIADGSNFTSTMSRFYNVLTSKSNATDNYLSKTWGINEWGDWNTTQNPNVYTDYAQAKAAIDNNTYPNIKLWDDYDATGTHDARVGYSYSSGQPDSTEQADYNAFAQDAHFTDAYYAPPPADTTAPTVSLSSPASGATLTGTVTMSGSASDNVGVSSVSYYLDGTKLNTDTSSPYSYSFNSSSYSEGAHTLQLKASDAAGNVGSSAVVSVTFHNAVTNPDPGGGTGGGGSGGTGGGSGGSDGGGTTTEGGTTTTIEAGKTTDDPVAVKGTLVIAPTSDGSSLSVKVDGKEMSGNSVNTTKLTNGTHTVTIIENGKAVQQQIVVHNAWPTAIANEIQAHKVAYTAGTGTALVVIAGLVWLFRRRISFWLLRHIRLRYLKWFGLSEILKIGIRR